MKPLLLAAAVLLIAPVVSVSGAHAQVAAGSVPNSFDAPTAAPAQAAPPAPAAAAVAPVNPASEEALRTIIAGAQAGTVDYALMTDDLAAKVREQEATVLPLIQGFGPLVSLGFVGSQNGADLYGAVFANAATQWVIGFNDEGKVAALLFRPAE